MHRRVQSVQVLQINLLLNFSFYLHSSAIDKKTGEKVAIKKLCRPFQSEIFAKRAYRELTLLKHMQHESVSYHFLSFACTQMVVSHVTLDGDGKKP